MGLLGSPMAPEPVVFLFPGQGSQWRGMATELMRCAPAFREELGACDAIVRSRVGWSVLEELASPSRLDRIEVVQPFGVVARRYVTRLPPSRAGKSDKRTL